MLNTKQTNVLNISQKIKLNLELHMQLNDYLNDNEKNFKLKEIIRKLT